MFTINCRGRLVALDRPQAMGIINVTPDSFYEGHLAEGPDGILTLARKMVADGATILDIGGQSTRPGSERVGADEEMARVLPVVELLHKTLPETMISIDTYHAAVAETAVEAGASLVNDISGGLMDAAMLPTVAGLRVPYVCMHIQGRPETMQQNPVYSDVVTEVLDYFIERLAACRQAGILDILIDPGFGFGKTPAHNFALLKNLGTFSMLQCPLLVGLSRKSMICKTLGVKPAGALNGTTALHVLALQNGAQILRVHDVKEAVETVRLWEAYQGVNNEELIVNS
jgi:dihydropteroate synthase